MSEPLVFLMGKFEARIPVDRQYFESHMWVLPQQENLRVGFTSYAVRLLQDVYFLDWQIDPDTQVKRKQAIGEIESSKAVSSLYAPANGQILEFNPAVLSDPSAINTSGYDQGWLYRFRTDAEFLAPEDYLTHLASGWVKTQNLLKGQVNEG